MPSSLPIDGTPIATDPPVAGSLDVVVHRPRADTVLVCVIGEVDLDTAPRLRRMLLEAARSVASDHGTAGVEADSPGRGQVVCDLSNVAFLGAAGLGALVRVAAAARDDGVDLRIVTGTRIARRVLTLSGLDRDLDTSEQLVDVLAPAPRP